MCARTVYVRMNVYSQAHEGKYRSKDGTLLVFTWYVLEYVRRMCFFFCPQQNY